jgi:MscS family membrane protein
MAWFKTSDFNQFRVWRQDILIAFMETVEQAKSSFAFPTRTVHLVGGAAPATPRNP